MSLRLREIRFLGKDEYEVTFDDEGGAVERVVCRVFEHKGVPAITMEPPVMIPSLPRINSREVAAAVIAHHYEASGEPEKAAKYRAHLMESRGMPPDHPSSKPNS